MAAPEISVHDNPERSRYEVFVDGDLAGYSAYRDVRGRRVFTHTTIDPDYEGHGVGSALARAALDDVRTQVAADRGAVPVHRRLTSTGIPITRT